jgi:Holliday junction resolvasome RuvABC endonuclease subunit
MDIEQINAKSARKAIGQRSKEMVHEKFKALFPKAPTNDVTDAYCLALAFTKLKGKQQRSSIQ